MACVLPETLAHAASDPDVAQIARRIRENRERLLQLPGGLRFRFRVDSEQRRESPYFLFPAGLDGTFAVKWPQIHNAVSGVLHGIITTDENGRRKKVARMTELEGSYDFETKTSVSLNNEAVGRIVGKRTSETSYYSYPFTFQYYAEFAKVYFPGEELKTDYWLPNAIEQYPYRVVGQETIDGFPCQALERVGIDKLWIAVQHGYVVLKRELHWGVGKAIRERMWGRQLREVSPGAWMPMEVIRDQFDKDNADKRLVRYMIQVKPRHQNLWANSRSGKSPS